MKEARRNEIAWILYVKEMKSSGIRLLPNFEGEILKVSSNTGICRDELIDFIKPIVYDVAGNIFSVEHRELSDLTEKRRNEIAWILMKAKLTQKGLVFSNLKRELGNVSKETGIHIKELKTFAEEVIREIVDETFPPSKKFEDRDVIYEICPCG